MIALCIKFLNALEDVQKESNENRLLNADAKLFIAEQLGDLAKLARNEMGDYMEKNNVYS